MNTATFSVGCGLAAPAARTHAASRSRPLLPPRPGFSAAGLRPGAFRVGSLSLRSVGHCSTALPRRRARGAGSRHSPPTRAVLWPRLRPPLDAERQRSMAATAGASGSGSCSGGPARRRRRGGGGSRGGAGGGPCQRRAAGALAAPGSAAGGMRVHVEGWVVSLRVVLCSVEYMRPTVAEKWRVKRGGARGASSLGASALHRQAQAREPCKGHMPRQVYTQARSLANTPPAPPPLGAPAPGERGGARKPEEGGGGLPALRLGLLLDPAGADYSGGRHPALLHGIHLAGERLARREQQAQRAQQGSGQLLLERCVVVSVRLAGQRGKLLLGTGGAGMGSVQVQAWVVAGAGLRPGLLLRRSACWATRKLARRTPGAQGDGLVAWCCPAKAGRLPAARS